MVVVGRKEGKSKIQLGGPLIYFPGTTSTCPGAWEFLPWEFFQSPDQSPDQSHDPPSAPAHPTSAQTQPPEGQGCMVTALRWQKVDFLGTSPAPSHLTTHPQTSHTCSPERPKQLSLRHQEDLGWSKSGPGKGPPFALGLKMQILLFLRNQRMDLSHLLGAFQTHKSTQLSIRDQVEIPNFLAFDPKSGRFCRASTGKLAV